MEDVQHGDDGEQEGHGGQGGAAEGELPHPQQDRDAHGPVKADHDPPVQQLPHLTHKYQQQDDVQDVADHEDVRPVDETALLRDLKAHAQKPADDVGRDDHREQQGGHNGDAPRVPMLHAGDLGGVQAEEEERVKEKNVVQEPAEINQSAADVGALFQQRVIGDVDPGGQDQDCDHGQIDAEAAGPADVGGQQQDGDYDADGDHRHIARVGVLLEAKL